MTIDGRGDRHDLVLCGARKRQGGGTCTQVAGWGTDHVGAGHCKLHGGSTRSQAVSAVPRAIEARARVLVQTYGAPIETTATQALLDEVQRTAGHVAWLGDRVREIESVEVAGTGSEHPLVWGVTKEKSGGEDRGTTEEAVPSVWVRLYQQERAHLVKVCSEAIRAGIEERRVRLAEAQGVLVAQAIRAILADLDLTAEQQMRVPEIVPRHLRALAAADGGA
ncbi:hypothetical protein AB8A21_09655 [Streptomyces sp. BF23-18]|uniref:hypothetical protein n=1 Tax=Streptomyces sp. BF23-18 TaxID=3240282 RepID=UPI0034E39271